MPLATTPRHSAVLETSSNPPCPLWRPSAGSAPCWLASIYPHCSPPSRVALTAGSSSIVGAPRSPISSIDFGNLQSPFEWGFFFPSCAVFLSNHSFYSSHQQNPSFLSANASLHESR